MLMFQHREPRVLLAFGADDITCHFNVISCLANVVPLKCIL
jgi:hypothetical protein